MKWSKLSLFVALGLSMAACGTTDPASMEMSQNNTNENNKNENNAKENDGVETFSQMVNTAIVDDDMKGVESKLVIDAKDVEFQDVQVLVTTTHPNASQFGILLERPDGEVEILSEPKKDGPKMSADKLVFDLPNVKELHGTWTINLWDEVSGDTGDFVDWSIKAKKR